MFNFIYFLLETYMKKTIYIAKPIGSHLRLINKRDPTCLKVNQDFIKYGKSHDIESRIKDYKKDNDDQVRMYGVVDCDHLTDEQLRKLETAVGRRVKDYRQDNPGRKIKALLEWCKNLDEEELKNIIQDEFNKIAAS